MSRSKSNVVSAPVSAPVAMVDNTTAPIAAAPVEQVKTPVNLANATGAEQAAAIIGAMNSDGRKVAAAALVECKGNVDMASTYLGARTLPTLYLIARIIPILRNSAPAALFTDGNNRGARVGELFASPLGLSSLFRDVNRASLKDARAALIDGAK